MEGMNLSDLVLAHRAYAQARSRAIESAHDQGSDARKATRLHRLAMLEHLQTRVRLLTDARKREMEQYDAEIHRYEQRIKELEQMLGEDSGAPIASAKPAATVVETSKSDPKKKKDKKSERA